MVLLSKPRFGLALTSSVEDIASALYTEFDTSYTPTIISQALEEISIEKQSEQIESSELPANYGDFYN
jgi:hypothetical protein